MSSHREIAQLVNRRQKRRSAEKRHSTHRSGRFGIAFLSILSVLIAAAAIWAGLAYAQVTQDLPAIERLPVLLAPPEGELLSPTVVMDRSGETVLYRMQNPNAATARYLSLAEIPPVVINAHLAVLDPGFREHDGYTLSDLRSPTTTTFAEGLASDLLLWDEPASLNRNLRLRLLAAQATRTYGREQLLEWALNSLPYGQYTRGIDQAAWVYFGKSAADLSLAEAAMLAAAAQSPALNPIDAPQLALQNQSEALQAMLAQGYLSQEEALAANNTPLTLQSPAAPPNELAPAFVEYALTQLGLHIPEERLLRGGLKIITTLDLDLQAQAECTTAVQQERLIGQLPLDTLAGVNCDTARLLPRLRSSDANAEEGLLVQAVVLDPQNGQILAFVGSPDAPRTAGTVLSPFVYLTAFTRGLSPSSLIWDVPASLPIGLEGTRNFDGEWHGPLNLRSALAGDTLVPALHLLSQVGPINAWRTAQQSGFTSLNAPVGLSAYNLLLDQGDVSVLEAAQAYGMLANQGVLAGQPAAAAPEGALEASALLRVEDLHDRALLDWSIPLERAITNAQLAYLLNHILSDPRARLNSPFAASLEVGQTAAAKIGQTPSALDSWTVGYSPQRVVAVWLGYPAEMQSSELAPPPLSGAGVTGLWQALFKQVHTNLPAESWAEPVGLSHITVCVPSGLLPTVECPQVSQELFMPGNEPVSLDNLYLKVLVNRSTNRLATIYTAPELVEERVYLNVPPEAEDWAREAGVELAPKDYDAIFTGSMTKGPVAITSPAIFGTVSGEVTINGRANPLGFAFYRIQVGEGLYPLQWLQVGEDIRTPLEEGQLAVWDTTGLNGLYAIQLLVVNQDQTVETTAIQVTIDNQPPEIIILHPVEGQHFKSPQESNITFQAQVNDNLGDVTVEFYVDDTLLSRHTNPPFAAPWQGNLGEHTLRIRAVDQAGNVSEAQVDFVIER